MCKEDLIGFARQKLCIEVINRKQERNFIKLCIKNGEKPARRSKDTYDMGKKPIYPIYYGFIIVKDNIMSGWCSINEEYVTESGFGKVDFQTFKQW